MKTYQNFIEKKKLSDKNYDFYGHLGENKMATLEDAISIAALAHQGQTDKGGATYILHPLRMMMRMKSEAAMIVAVLHDVVEDSDWTIDKLRQKGFSEEVLEAG